MIKNKNILFVGPSLSSQSALTYVLVEIMKQTYNDIKNTGNITYLNLFGSEYKKDNFIKIYDAEKLASKIEVIDYLPNKQVNIDSVIQGVKPDIVFSCLDPWHLEEIAFSAFKETFLWVAYTTVETPKYPEQVLFPKNQTYKHVDIKEILEQVDILIPFTPMGQKALFNLGLEPVEYIYPGISLEKRYTKEISKAKAFSMGVQDDDFVFMTVGINNERKNMGYLLEVFRDFLNEIENPDKYKLYMHTDIYKEFGGTDLLTLSKELLLQKNVIFKQPNVVYSTIDLFSYYKACDCYISLTGSEGFGYGFAEAMLHEKPLIYTMYAGNKDFCSGHGVGIECKEYKHAMNFNSKIGIPDLEYAKIVMKEVAKSSKLRLELTQDSLNFVKKHFDWNIQYKKIQEIVNQKYNIFKSYNKIVKDFNLKRVV